MFTIETERLPIQVWGESVDDATLEQARHLANLPFAFHHIALMADAHVGYGMPIGGVFAASGQVIPNAVGLDIGCGVRAWRTNVPVSDLLPVRDAVLDAVSRAVPQGFDWHDASQADRTDLFGDMPDIPVLLEERGRAERQLASLGGGNHFIELQADPEGLVWAMVHTGSRNIGKQVAAYFDRIARERNRKEASEVPPDWELAHLPVDSEDGRAYREAMGWCLRFALESRRLIAESVQAALDQRAGGGEPDDAIDVHHNYVSAERHFGADVMVHRKGAVHARGTVFIPGSMSTASYVGEGLADPDAFESCSHGAGRVMGRHAAMRALPRTKVLAELEKRGVLLVKRHLKDVAEEAPEAYKDIDQVMRWQRDLVRPAVRLRPVAVLKG